MSKSVIYILLELSYNFGMSFIYRGGAERTTSLSFLVQVIEYSGIAKDILGRYQGFRFSGIGIIGTATPLVAIGISV